ncbi:MAG TPA: Gfo/Idh/MocA family oxidoreductase [Candidatus Tumulicola sp.]|jgi:UDP-2-acetamido-3-amino-2,3-dideoxy-glucuronate N-acetyltransferase
MIAPAKPRIGVAGAGAWGRNLVRNCAEAGVLAAICDENSAALDALAGEYRGVRCVAGYEQFLQLPIDAVIVATPARRHCEMALAAIDAGKHVFVEKPFAIATEEAEAVVARAQARGLTSFAGHILLYHPAIEELLQRVRAGAIGEVRHVRSRRLGLGRLRSFENVWWSFAPHDVAVVLAIAGDSPTDCSSQAVDVTGSGIADFGYADYSFSNGLTAHVEVGWLEPTRSHRLDVIGTLGTLTLSDSRDGAGLTLHVREISAGPQGQRELKVVSNSEIPFRDVEPLRAEIDAFVRSIETKQPAVTDGRSAIGVTAALAMAEACSLPATAALV